MLINSLMSVLYKLVLTSDVSTTIGVHYYIIILFQIVLYLQLQTGFTELALPCLKVHERPNLGLAAVCALGMGPHLIIFVGINRMIADGTGVVE